MVFGKKVDIFQRFFPHVVIGFSSINNVICVNIKYKVMSKSSHFLDILDICSHSFFMDYYPYSVEYQMLKKNGKYVFLDIF